MTEVEAIDYCLSLFTKRKKALSRIARQPSNRTGLLFQEQQEERETLQIEIGLLASTICKLKEERKQAILQRKAQERGEIEAIKYDNFYSQGRVPFYEQAGWFRRRFR